MTERDTQGIIADLRRRYPEGFAGGPEQLVTALMNDEGLEHRQAIALSEQLQSEHLAHHLPGDSPRWLFTTHPVSLGELMRRLDASYATYLSQGGDPRDEFISFMNTEMGLEEGVSEQVLRGLEQAGYTSVVYQEDLARDRMFVRFPEAFRPVA